MAAAGRKQTEEHKAKRAAAVRSTFAARTHKRCPRCRTEKPIDEFRRRSSGPLKSYCLPCEQQYSRDKWSSRTDGDREKAAQANRRVVLRTKYGITPCQYDKMLSDQGGCCAICQTDSPGSRHKYFSVDHDHMTGAVRGLLCNNCNRAIGLLRDCPGVLSRAVDYLTRSGKSDAGNDNSLGDPE